VFYPIWLAAVHPHTNLLNKQTIFSANHFEHLRPEEGTPIIGDTMKKKLIIGASLLLTLVLLAAGILVFKLNDIVAGLRPQIEQQLSKALGAKVELGELSASLFPSVHLSIREAKVLAPDGGAPTLSVGGITASVALGPLLKKQLKVSKLQLENPSVTIIQDSTGMRVKGLSPQQARSQQPPTENPPVTSSVPEKTIDVHISRIEISRGALTLEDTSTKTKTEVRSINLDAGVALQGQELKVPNLSLSLTTSPFPPLAFSGKEISFSQDTGKLTIGALDARMDAGSIHSEGTVMTSSLTGSLAITSKGIDLRKLAAMAKNSHPALAAMNLSGAIAANVGVTFNGSPIPSIKGPITLVTIDGDLPGPTKMRGLSGAISLQGIPSDLSVSAPDIKVSIQDSPLSVATNAKITQSMVAVQTLTIRGLGGETKLPTTIQLSQPQKFSIQPNLFNVSIGELLKIAKPQIAQMISGTIASSKGTFTGNTSGDIARSVSGSGELLVTNALLKGVNLPNVVLSKVSSIPLLEGTLRAHIAPEHQKFFNDPNTSIKELQVVFGIASGAVTISSLKAVSAAFSLQSSGSLTMDGDLNLSSTMTLSTEISKALGARSKTVRAMLNDQQQLAIPVLIKGRSPSILVTPDVSKLLEGAGGKILQEKAGGLLNKALGGKNEINGKNPLKGLFGR
jgi:hypothetical protein